MAPGKLRESDRDAVEEEIGAYVRAVSRSIEQLQRMVRVADVAGDVAARQQGRQRSQQQAPTPDAVAHRQGAVLILSERLGALTSAFDRLRGLRYQQLQQEAVGRARRLPKQAQQQGHVHGHGQAGARQPMTSREAHDRLHGQLQQRGDGAAAALADERLGAPSHPQHAQQQQQQQQQLIDAENQALQLELLALSEQVEQTERSVREVAALNQMFSTAVMHQSEQIERLYMEVRVCATGNKGRFARGVVI